MPTKRTLVVEKLSPHYEVYADYLEEEHGITVPADHLQAALRFYAAFQKSDANKAAKAERAKERAAEEKATAKTKTATKRTGRKATKTADEEDEDEDEEDEAPTPAKKTPAKRAGRGSKAAF